MPFDVAGARSEGYSDPEILTYLSGKNGLDGSTLPGNTLEEKIQALYALTGTKELPYEYADASLDPRRTATAVPALSRTALQTAPVAAAGAINTQPAAPRRNMSYREIADLWNQGIYRGPQNPVGPMSLTDLVMEPVSALLDEADLAKYVLPLTLLGMVRNRAGRDVPGTETPTGGYIPSPASIEREAAKILESSKGDLTEKQALRRAAQKLVWQEWEKPRIENHPTRNYGQLRPGVAGAPKRRLLQNTPAAVAERIERVRDVLAQPVTPWVPKDYGSFDRSLIPQAAAGFPDVEQSVLVRPTPPKADVSYMDEMYLDPVNRDLIKRQIERGLRLGGETFYPSYYPIKHGYLEHGGTTEKFDRWAESVAAGSAQNSLNNELAVGNTLLDMYYRGIPLTPEEVSREMLRYKREMGTGLPLVDVHRLIAARRLEQGITMKELMEQGITDRFKIPTYGMQRRGDFRHTFTGDTHESAGHTFGNRMHPYFWEQGGFGTYEYGPAESHFRDITREMDLPAVATGQAGRWFGGGPLTGLVSAEGDALEQIEKQAAWTLYNKGLPYDPVSVRKHIFSLIDKGGRMRAFAPSTEKPVMPDVRIARPGGGR